MKANVIFLIGFVVLGFASFSAAAEKMELKYPNSANKLYIDSGKVDEYQRLAKSIGFEVNQQYRFREYADITRNNKVGEAGAYDFLLLSTGGNGWDFEAVNRMNKEKCGWEMNYYSNHDLTMIHEICHDDSRIHSFVRIIKIAKGKRPQLHLE